MSQRTMPAVRKLLELVTFDGESSLSDAVLLERFVQQGDEQAFATLLHRHAPMVWRVCRRRLRDAQTAEDAFQATFLVLARKAASVRNHEAVAAWLHGVAYRLSGKARRGRDYRELTGSGVEAQTEADPLENLTLRELREVIDEELQALAEQHRGPLVLCYLEGKTRDEAAQQLGLPLGTLKSRLEKGRELLRRRLLRRGLIMPASLGVLVLSAQAASAGVPAALVPMTRQAALAFAAGRSATMFATSTALRLAQGALPSKGAALKLTAALILVGVLGGGVGVFSNSNSNQAAAEPPLQQTAVEALAQRGPQPPPKPEEKASEPKAVPALGKDVEKPPTWKDMQKLRRRLSRPGDERRFEAAEAALAWIVKQQADDGHWSIDNAIDKQQLAGTGFALQSLLNAGHTHTAADDPYARNIKRGLGYLLEKQGKDGNLGAPLYTHAVATMALCRALALTRDPALKGPATSAVDYIVKAQHEGGGWRYAPQSPGDLSATGYVVAALHEARAAGIAVPKNTLDGAFGFLGSCGDLKNGYAYLPQGGGVKPTTTAIGRLAHYRLKGIDDPDLRGARLLEKSPATKEMTLYPLAWVAPLVHAVGGEPGRDWLNKGIAGLIDQQDQGKTNAGLKGSWDPQQGGSYCTGSRLMTTSLAVQVLMVSQEELPFAAAPTRELKGDDVKQAWNQLEAADPLETRRAVWALVGSPRQAVKLLEEHLPKAPPPVDDKRVTQLLKELDDDAFAVREKANAALKDMGPVIDDHLRQALAKPIASLEARRRVEVLVRANARTTFANRQRYLHMIEALEWIGTAESRAAIDKLLEKTLDPEVKSAGRTAIKRLGDPR
jgi:RNA polymerase sigma-70 factor (ECF subfamily)